RRRDLPGDRALPADRAGGSRMSGGQENGQGGLGERATPKRGLGPSEPMRRGPGAFMSGMSTEKSLDFRGSSKRLLRTLAPQRLLVTLSLLLAAGSVTLSVLGPRLLGDATNLIFTGGISERIPAGVSKAAVIARLGRAGKGPQADLLPALPLTAGRGIDFGHVGRVLALVLIVYVVSAAGMLMQGRVTAMIVQRQVFGLREQVQAKL